ncbi:MAG: hypothetical protein ABMA01_17170 [Chthoniobacteraceae bacterium]
MSTAGAPNFRWRKWLDVVLLLALLALTFVARCHNRAQVFHHGGVFFVDGDCYSRMTRAKLVTEGKWVIRRHDFENWPDGITPHTTAPLDWLICALKPVVGAAISAADPTGGSVLRGQSLDVAGAVIAPLLGVITAAWLWWWAGRMRVSFRPAILLLFALSPILVHGTVLGRPDHQALLILLLAIAFGCEIRLVHSADDERIVRRAWSIGAGTAWGIALWVSLYEPMVLLLAVIAMRLVCDRENMLARGRRSGWLALVGWVALGLLVDGWRIRWPDPAVREYFGRWSATIGELRHLDLAGPLLWQWIGLLGLVSPVLLGIAGRGDRRAFGILAAVLLLLAFTIWQLRWGYFLCLAFAMSLPWQLAALRRPWLGWAAFAIGLWPLVTAWSRTLHPGENAREDQEWRNFSQSAMRRFALKMRGDEKAAFLAPWWMSPQVAYWSGQPGVAGTSHQSLAGTIDSARFYLSTDAAEASGILRRRQVKWVIADTASYDASRREALLAVTNSATLLDRPAPEEPLALTLAERPREAPPFLREVTPAQLGLVRDMAPERNSGDTPGMRIYAPQIHRLYRVQFENP